MLRRILAVIAGVFTGWLIIFIGDAATHTWFPAPMGINMKHEDAVRTFMSQLPTIVLLIMFAFWLLAAFAAGFVSARIEKNNWKRATIITGVILFAATILNMIFIPHPAWMVAATILLFIPAAYFGGKIAS